MSFSDSIFIFGLALIIFGPKKLPEIGRQIGKLLLEFRRASNEFKMQIEDELRAAEQEERKKELAAAATEPSGGLTVQPPATGAPVSADSPTAGAIAASTAPAPASPEVYSYPYPGSGAYGEADGTEPAQPTEEPDFHAGSNGSAVSTASFDRGFGADPSTGGEAAGESPGESMTGENSEPAVHAADLQTAAETTVSHHG